MKITYMEQPPKRYTFEQPKLKLWVEQHCHGTVLNLFAGKVKLNVNEIRNDMDINMEADYHADAHQLVEDFIRCQRKFDTIVLDPPYSLRKSREKYEGRIIGCFTKIKNVIGQILSPNGRIITLGYSSTGMSRSRGFKKIALCIVCHNGDHDNTVVVAEDAVISTEDKDLFITVEEAAS